MAQEIDPRDAALGPALLDLGRDFRPIVRRIAS